MDQSVSTTSVQFIGGPLPEIISELESLGFPGGDNDVLLKELVKLRMYKEISDGYRKTPLFLRSVTSNIDSEIGKLLHDYSKIGFDNMMDAAVFHLFRNTRSSVVKVARSVDRIDPYDWILLTVSMLCSAEFYTRTTRHFKLEANDAYERVYDLCLEITELFDSMFSVFKDEKENIKDIIGILGAFSVGDRLFQVLIGDGLIVRDVFTPLTEMPLSSAIDVFKCSPLCEHMKSTSIKGKLIVGPAYQNFGFFLHASSAEPDYVERWCRLPVALKDICKLFPQLPFLNLPVADYLIIFKAACLLYNLCISDSEK